MAAWRAAAVWGGPGPRGASVTAPARRHKLGHRRASPAQPAGQNQPGRGGKGV